MSHESRPLDLAEIVTEVVIAAARDTVWTELTARPARWWHPAYFSDPRGAEVGSFRIEAELGGRMFEDWGDGQGLVWGVVVALDHGRTLQVVGDTSPAWGGPSRHWFTWKLEDAGSGTRLRFENAIWGRVSEATRASLEEGWRYLFEHGLKRWCETGTLDGAPPAPGS
ncbi:MAG TPA: SRPBCC domain-containing protein [Planctomycetota bacterium]|nr:SRPBCC domain-containing protein [Planctomycetota bacterium]